MVKPPSPVINPVTCNVSQVNPPVIVMPPAITIPP